MSYLAAGTTYSQQTLSVPVPLAPLQSGQAITETRPESHEPERWTTEDITLDEQFATAKKEAMAAYQIALDECKHSHTTDLTGCQNQARRDMEADMSRIKAQFGMPH